MKIKSPITGTLAVLVFSVYLTTNASEQPNLFCTTLATIEQSMAQYEPKEGLQRPIPQPQNSPYLPNHFQTQQQSFFRYAGWLKKRNHMKFVITTKVIQLATQKKIS